ncbi:MAG TPA: tetratricopeptide repeat protein, partial [Spirochaetota bacterium]|nr:tetratricopeptide repeat protein [Spirochaetota bacterium]
AYKNNVLFHPISLLIILMGIISHGSSSGSMIKPELFTYVFMSITVFIWWMFILDKEKNYKLLYFLPLVILIWVNSHGGFIFAAPFFVCIIAGSLLNYKFSNNIGFTPFHIKHIIIASALSLFATFITPYGYKYHLSLLSGLLLKPDIENLKTVSAYGPTLVVPTYVLYFGIPIILLLYVFFSTKHFKKLDWVFVTTNIIYAILYTIFGRLMYYWIPVYVFSILYYTKDDVLYYKPKKKWVPALIITLSLIVALDQVRWQTLINFTNSITWFGFGDSYINSHEEAEFIATYYPGYKVGNPYNCGGYFLWRLYPQNKIMIDPRYFPFKSWYREYIKFMTNQDVDKFLQKYDFDILHLQHMDLLLYPHFLTNPDWKLAFYGTGGMVFVKRHIPLPDNRIQRSEYIFSYPSLHQSSLILSFALRIGDWETCERILQHMKSEFTWFNQIKFVEAAENLYMGTRAYFRRQYDTALTLYEKALGKVPVPPNILSAMYHYKAVDLWTEGKTYEALDYIKKVLETKDDDPYGLYNLGVINWYIYKKQLESGVSFLDDNQARSIWLKPFEAFIQFAKDKPGAKPALDIVNAIINGKYTGKPPLIYPPEPKQLQ